MPTPPAEHEVEILRVEQETPVDRTFSLPVPAGAEAAFRFVPGQFLTVIDPEDDRKPPRRKPYSISSAPEDVGSLDVTVRDMGEFGKRFYAFPAGKRLRVIAPRGHFTLDATVTGELLLLAGGSGVAPYRGFVRHLRARGHDLPVTLAYSARVPEELVFDAEFRRHAREAAWFRYVPTVTRLLETSPFDGLRGRLTADVLRPRVRDAANATLYACGPDSFVDAALVIGLALGVPPARLRKEKWG
jgi:3-phenylpropionate/trans-cinnamate dioxygenase ferredoxin reductase subunit